MESHLLQMRGLKQLMMLVIRLLLVASFTDAWIETISINTQLRRNLCRIFYRCVD